MLLFRKKITGWDSFVDEATSGVFPYLAAVSNPDAGQWDDITSIVNWHLYGKHIIGDYIWMQRRVNESFQAKTGATETLKWANCDNTEKDLIIYYN